MSEFTQNVIMVLAAGFVGGLMVMLFGGLVGDSQSGVGGTRFPNGLSADGTSPSAGEVRGTSFQLDNGSATTTFIADKLCIQGTESDGTTIYYFFGPNGDWATSSSACN